MCQLLAMNSKHPADIGFSFSGFRLRGGVTDNHIDGFGIAYFEPTGLRHYCDDHAAMDSPIAALVSQTRIKCTNTLVHIRLSGDSALRNAHPFVREIWGEAWAFSHNGKMAIKDAPLSDAIHQCLSHDYCPIGDTDSEFAFCYLLNQLKAQFACKPDEETLYQFLTMQCRALSAYGLFNCLLTNGEWMLSYANTLLFYVTRRAPFASATLIDSGVTQDLAALNQDDDVMTVLATTPLTSDEDWQQLAIDECVVFKDGDSVYRDAPEDPSYLSIDEGLKLAEQA